MHQSILISLIGNYTRIAFSGMLFPYSHIKTYILSLAPLGSIFSTPMSIGYAVLGIK